MQGHQTGSKWLPGQQVLIVTSTKELPDLNNKFVPQEEREGVLFSVIKVNVKMLPGLWVKRSHGSKFSNFTGSCLKLAMQSV